MNKKFLSAIAVLLTLLLLTGVLTACGKQDGKTEKTKASDVSGDSQNEEEKPQDTGISSDLLDRYQGDWNGCVMFTDGTGKYETLTGTVGAIARLLIDQSGKITPFIGLDVEDTPIEDLTATFDSDHILISGKWIKAEFQHVPLTESGGTLSTKIDVSKDAGSVSLTFNFRRLDDTGWTDEQPGFSESQINACKGKSFDELAEMLGYSKSDYPADEGEAKATEPDAGKEEQSAAPGAIVGSWEYAAPGYSYIYTFREDGTGSYTAGTTVMNFTYEDSGTKVTILYDGNTSPNEFAYTISGNTLSIEDSFGEKIEYKKK